MLGIKISQQPKGRLCMGVTLKHCFYLVRLSFWTYWLMSGKIFPDEFPHCWQEVAALQQFLQCGPCKWIPRCLHSHTRNTKGKDCLVARSSSPHSSSLLSVTGTLLLQSASRKLSLLSLNLIQSCCHHIHLQSILVWWKQPSGTSYSLSFHHVFSSSFFCFHF